MSKTGGTTRSTATSAPPGFQQPYVDTALSEANRLYQTPGPQYYQGNTVAGFAPAENLARNYLQGDASASAARVAEGAEGGFNNLLKSIDVNNNPYLKSAVSGAIDPIFKSLTESVLPQLRSGSVASGGYGGSRQGIAEGLAVDRTTQNALNTTSGMMSGAYNQGLQSVAQALQLAPTVQQAKVAPGEILSSVGAQERAMNQANIDADIAKWTYNQNLPYTKLAEFSNLISRPYGGTSESTTVAPQTGSAEQITGATAALLPLLGQIFKLFG